MSKSFKIKVTVASIHDADRPVKKLFNDILLDYCERYSVLPIQNWHVMLCFVEYEDHNPKAGTTVWRQNDPDSDRILIQVRDPWINDWESNPYMVHGFVRILCHEIIHACQVITGRKGFSIPKLKYDKNNERESYYFDPMEVEARALCEFYAYELGNIIVE